MNWIAITQVPSPRLAEGELTFVQQSPLNMTEALKQHIAYCALLEKLGAQVVRMEANSEQPDGVFVEDTAVVLDEVAILTRPGAQSRRAEVEEMRRVLGEYRPLETIGEGATLDGGDVLKVGKTLFVGRSGRTNDEGIQALAKIASRHGYEMAPILVTGCLHLKTGMTALDDHQFLVNPKWLDTSPLASQFHLVHVPEEEPWGACTIRFQERTLMASEHPRTIHKVSSLGYRVESTPLSEFAKIEGGVTCLSLLFNSKKGGRDFLR